jgi:uncharacterized protein (DUF2141 family)
MTSSLLLWILATVAPAGDATLTVTVDGLESGEGAVRVALYAAADDFLKKENALHKATIPIRDGTATWTVDSVPPGGYALSVFHDENGNGELDKNSLGIPREAYGFSNDARGQFGPPKWDEARFEVLPGGHRTRVRVR